MWNRRRISIALFALSATLFAAYFEPTRCVRGWLWGEAFFDGRPTSYWRGRIDRWMEKYATPELAAGSLLVRADSVVVEFDPTIFM